MDIDKKKIVEQTYEVLATTRDALARVKDKASEKERVIIERADTKAAVIQSALKDGTFTPELAIEAAGSVERTMRNELEALDDQTRKTAQHVTVRSAILGGFQLVLGLLGTLRG